MKISSGWQQWLDKLINPDADQEIDELIREHRLSIPVLWLMGKTGAGKTSIIQRLTGDTRAQIGNGFEPCTSGSMFYDHPSKAPVIRFLDTRGLGEADYDPSSDLKASRLGSHALLIVTRLDDPNQKLVCDSLEKLRISSKELAILQIHSAIQAIEPNDLDRVRQVNERQIEQALGFTVPSVLIDFTHPEDGFDNPDLGLADLRLAIIDLVPELFDILRQNRGDGHEEAAFLKRRREILGHCSAAAAVDLLPTVGLVAVPGIQGKMLHLLAARYGIDWDKRMATEFIAALGSSFLYRYVWSLAGRQLLKFVPLYGQSAGAAAAASISFASTYALGRAACLYFYKRQHHEAIDPEALKDAFSKAFDEQRH
ncbi:MAG: YcjF family protein [Granulosicoccus sp.]